ncbi:unnamed protein product, partial [Meganyctiphanes norvegica]
MSSDMTSSQESNLREIYDANHRKVVLIFFPDPADILNLRMCGVAVVSGQSDCAIDVLTQLTSPRTIPRPRYASLRYIVHPNTGERLDRGLVLWFPGPHSFTGEDSCEIQIHGGVAVTKAILEALSQLQGYEPAQPGDFTKRAFYNNKLDLTSIEGLGDLIHAETEAQRKQALHQMDGALNTLYSSWRRSLINARSRLEAYIDFSEDENIEDGVVAETEIIVKRIIQELEKHLSDNRRGERLRSGLHLAIIGPPNVGKSSLLNMLVQRPAAIVSPIPGTTRDILETTLDIGGYPVILSDTAGLRETDDIVESEGVKRALDRAQNADLVLILVEAFEMVLWMKSEEFSWEKFIKTYIKKLGIDCNLGNGVSENYSSENFIERRESDINRWLENNNYLILINKMDLLSVEDINDLNHHLQDQCCLISVKTEEGLKFAMQKLVSKCSSLCEVGTAENPQLTTARHRTHLTHCLQNLQHILQPLEYSEFTCNYSYDTKMCDIIKSDSVMEIYSNRSPYQNEYDNDANIDQSLLSNESTLLLAAHQLQLASTQLGHITGRITTEDVLDQIFSAFCIGKL